MYSSEILMCTYKCFALFIRQVRVLPITTNTIQSFIHKFMEKGNSQQSNHLKKIIKNSVHTFDIHTKCQ
jgi:hypothetical protein